MANAVDLGTTHVYAIGCLVRCMLDSSYYSWSIVSLLIVKLFNSICMVLYLFCYLIIYLQLLALFYRMEPFHLLDPYYEEKHRGRRTVEGEVLTEIFCCDLLFLLFLMH